MMQEIFEIGRFIRGPRYRKEFKLVCQSCDILKHFIHDSNLQF